ncbi:MAG: DUF3253 domain-containing protein [Pseudomonadota bacterium]
MAEARKCCIGWQAIAAYLLVMTPRDAIIHLLRQRRPDSSICPSEAARLVSGVDTWRDAMDPIREAARDLVAEGLILVTQRGSVVDPKEAKGPIRLRLGERDE